MPGLLEAALLQGGGQILGGLGGFLGGGADRRRAQKREDFSDLSRQRLNELVSKIISQQGQDVFNPNQFIEQIQRDIAPQQERFANQIARRQGGIGGVGAKQLFRQGSGLLGNRLIDLNKFKIGLGQQRDLAGNQTILNAFGRFA